MKALQTIYSIPRNISAVSTKPYNVLFAYNIMHSRWFSTIQKPIKLKASQSDFFKDLRVEDGFIDKSLMIKEVIEEGNKVTLVTRPRRWGKSANIDMLKTFLEIEVDEHGQPLTAGKQINKKFFAGGIVTIDEFKNQELQPLKIAQHPEVLYKLGQRPVINVNFKDIGYSNYQDVEEGLKASFAKTFGPHEYLLGSTKLRPTQQKLVEKYLDADVTTQQVKDAMGFLSQCLYRHFNKNVWILIDEYDSAINRSYLKFGADKENPYQFNEDFVNVLGLFRGVMGSALKTNPYLEKAFITGIFRIAKVDLFSSVSNIVERNLLDPEFSQYYGFSQEEVDYLLDLCQIPMEQRKIIEEWYNGYSYGGYNPWSIMRYLSSEAVEPQNYWQESGGFGVLEKLLLTDENQKHLQALMKSPGATVNTEITNDIHLPHLKGSEATMSLLLYTGYLDAINVDRISKICTVSIPNQEVTDTFAGLIKKWAANKLGVMETALTPITEELRQCNIQGFDSKLKDFLESTISFRTGKKVDESNYHYLMKGILYPMNNLYYVFHELESGDGYVDTILIPKPILGNNTAILLEYKHEEVKNEDALAKYAKKGLEQIDIKKYYAKLKDFSHVDTVVKIGMAFFKKNVEVIHETQDLSELIKNADIEVPLAIENSNDITYDQIETSATKIIGIDINTEPTQISQDSQEILGDNTQPPEDV